MGWQGTSDKLLECPTAKARLSCLMCCCSTLHGHSQGLPLTAGWRADGAKPGMELRCIACR